MTGLAPTHRAIVAGAAAASVATVLHPSNWFERFDPEAWIERWYRAGHRIAAGPDGHPVTIQNMDADEGHAARLRAELGWPTNRQAVLSLFSRDYRPIASGEVCGFRRRTA